MSLKLEAMHALDVQLGLINFYKTETGGQFLRGYFLDSYAGDSEPDIRNLEDEARRDAIEAHKDGQDGGEWDRAAWNSAKTMGANLVLGLNKAQTFIVTEDMMTLALKAGESVPHTPFTVDDLPSEDGFVILPRPLKTFDIHGKVMTARAFTWITSSVRRVTPWDPEGIDTPSLILVYFCSKNDWNEDDYLRLEHNDMREHFLAMPQYQMTHWQPIGFGEDWASNLTEVVSDQDFEKYHEAVSNYAATHPEEIRGNNASVQTMGAWSAFMKSFFLLVKQKIAVIHPQSPGRGALRRLSRSALMPEDGMVQVVTLRKERPASQEEITDGTPMEWSHRWIVSGHWRNQYYPSKGRHEPVWIEAYEKGPEDKPLVIKDKVFVWKR